MAYNGYWRLGDTEIINAPRTQKYVDTLMPTFGLDDANVNSIINYFGAVSNKMQPFETHQVVTAATTNNAVGRELRSLWAAFARGDSLGDKGGIPGALTYHAA